jgi:hypothetical protein
MDYDVITFQFSYLNIQAGDNIGNTATGFLAVRPGLYDDVHDLDREVGRVAVLK